MASGTRHSHKEKITRVRRGDIFLVSFDPTVGHEIQKTRPALIIQNDIGNQYSPLTIVSAMTSKMSAVPYPVEVRIEPSKGNGLEVLSSVRLDQIRTVDRQRLIKRLGTVEQQAMSKVDEALKISLGLVQL